MIMAAAAVAATVFRLVSAPVATAELPAAAAAKSMVLLGFRATAAGAASRSPMLARPIRIRFTPCMLLMACFRFHLRGRDLLNSSVMAVAPVALAAAPVQVPAVAAAVPMRACRPLLSRLAALLPSVLALRLRTIQPATLRRSVAYVSRLAALLVPVQLVAWAAPQRPARALLSSKVAMPAMA